MGKISDKSYTTAHCVTRKSQHRISRVILFCNDSTCFITSYLKPHPQEAQENVSKSVVSVIQTAADRQEHNMISKYEHSRNTSN